VSRHWDPFSVAPPPEPLPSSDTPVIEGNRWDDAYGKFSSLYAATTAAAAFGETISRYREKADLIAKIDAFLEALPILSTTSTPSRESYRATIYRTDGSDAAISIRGLSLSTLITQRRTRMRREAWRASLRRSASRSSIVV
jgi:hypothetical protein